MFRFGWEIFDLGGFVAHELRIFQRYSEPPCDQEDRVSDGDRGLRIGGACCDSQPRTLALTISPEHLE